MRLVTVRADEGERAGVLEGDRVLLTDEPLLDVAIRTGYDFSQARGTWRPLAEVRLERPLRPSAVFCLGQNYRDHLAEKAPIESKEPEFFLKAGDTVAQPDEPGPRPARDRQARLRDRARSRDRTERPLHSAGSRARPRFRLHRGQRPHRPGPPSSAAGGRRLRDGARTGQELRRRHAARLMGHVRRCGGRSARARADDARERRAAAVQLDAEHDSRHPEPYLVPVATSGVAPRLRDLDRHPRRHRLGPGSGARRHRRVSASLRAGAIPGAGRPGQERRSSAWACSSFDVVAPARFAEAAIGSLSQC